MTMQLRDRVNTSERQNKKALKIGIFSDNDSFFFKEKVGIYLDTKWTSLYDIGPSRLDQHKDIFKMALKLGEALETGKLEFGIVLLKNNCAAITVLLNKFKNVRAVFAENDKIIVNSRKEFNANAIVVENKDVTIDTKNCEREIDIFLSTGFEEGNRGVLDFIANAENINV
ncbi:MAG: RpiB/LacA/LacB family sugar-phosphate isomerase [Deltaproteobacteria bacterium]|jgi:ribose 5-phosphate isomerase RpiB|nr:RpiB/LacA/LacB family sugar-phosphate isomerase [Deltaproteobacteria bacterium]MCL5880661.1 RpiB/LacA/LacB family sugar-phosphate isomerase [Deltaproteobacteria bacterium]MDA8305172.1 RpiB/LacA/LacB family sugar-phosphate isomerase [Deltaproteobacteria bacterium]